MPVCSILSSQKGRDTPVVSLSIQNVHFIIYKDDSAGPWIPWAVFRVINHKWAFSHSHSLIHCFWRPSTLTCNSYKRSVLVINTNRAQGPPEHRSVWILKTDCIIWKAQYKIKMWVPFFKINKNFKLAKAEHYTKHKNLLRARPGATAQVSGPWSWPMLLQSFIWRYSEVRRLCHNTSEGPYGWLSIENVHASSSLQESSLHSPRKIIQTIISSYLW